MGDERREYDGPGHGDEPEGGQRGPDDTQAFDPFGEPEPPSSETSGDPRLSGDPDATVVSRPPDPEATGVAGLDPDATVIHGAPVPPDSTSILPQDGVVWSGRAGVPPPGGGPSLRDPVPYSDGDYGEPLPPQDGQRRWWTPVLLGVVALGLLGVVVLATWWMSRDRPGPEPSPTEIPAPTLAPTTSAPTAPPTTAAASPTVALVQVPQLVGTTQDQAAAALDALGLSYRFEYRASAEPQGEVVESRPREGEIVPSSSTVTLVISTGPAPRTTTATPRPPQPSASAEPDGGGGGAGE